MLCMQGLRCLKYCYGSILFPGLPDIAQIKVAAAWVKFSYQWRA
jgi:hypothetical protein